MAKGTVKDPTGHQSKSYDFGYIQRTEGFSLDEETKEIVSTLWEDDLKPKVIPFYNPRIENGRLYNFGDLVEFDVKEAIINCEEAGIKDQKIGIAVVDFKKTELLNRF